LAGQSLLLLEQVAGLIQGLVVFLELHVAGMSTSSSNLFSVHNLTAVMRPLLTSKAETSF
jgi:hypothetical protein